MKPIIFTSAYSHKHDTGAGHPESPARLAALDDLFLTAPFCDWPQKQSTPAEHETILLAHDEEYIFSLQDNTPDDGLFYLDGDTVLSPDSYNAALHGAGAACNAVDALMNDETTRAFCAVRPPGHHAEPSHAMGFCLLNNVFIAARYAQEKYGLQKIAIVDFDVHHGNGTETMCRRHNAAHPDAPIFYISTHGYPLFPVSGNPADNNEFILNLRLPDQCGSKDFCALYENHVFDALNAFKPEILMISAGFDAHIDDPLAQSALKTEDFGWITRKLCDIADKSGTKGVISVLEGGYHIPALTACVGEHLLALAQEM